MRRGGVAFDSSAGTGVLRFAQDDACACRAFAAPLFFTFTPTSLSPSRMPTYEYRCPDGHDFERFFRKISDAPAEVACPVCGKISERRMSAGAGLLFKGSGFYLTDYGKNAHRGEAPAASSE